MCVLEDRNRFILHHQVMVRETDDQDAVAMVTGGKEHFPRLSLCSFDKGFHTPGNQQELKAELAKVRLAKEGSAVNRRPGAGIGHGIRGDPSVAIRSQIRDQRFGGSWPLTLRNHGLDGFKRYVALALISRNIQRLGAVVRNLATTRRGPYKKRFPFSSCSIKNL
jgi:IS5 family transposase